VELRGFLNLNKPTGRTSRDVVNRVEWLAPKTRVGHAGTLDPLASGVLVVAVGGATRLIDYVQESRKQYTGAFLLGRHSNTEDISGEVVELIDPPQPTRQQLETAARRFVGVIEQRPPAFSAIKVKGKRSYKLARAGKPVELPARPIEIYRLEIIEYVYPQFVLELECSSGTYVRSLGRDLAESLDSAAVMSALVRTAVGNFKIHDAVDLEDLRTDVLPAMLRPIRTAAEHLPRMVLDEDEVWRVLNGQTIFRADVAMCPEIAALDPTGELISIMGPRVGGGWRPLRSFKN